MNTSPTTGQAKALPAQFSDLEKYTEKWCVDNERDRYDARLGSTMEEMQDFYDAIFSRGEEILEYFDQYSLDDLPEPELNLLRLFYALITVSFAVEVFQQPYIPDTGAAQLYFDLEPVP
ncbi:MAG: hypothetical protein QOH68_877 [Nocardioidaceae bacterium]|jgi:hypothetical protein|nr:hypothetical protein [Nocardioidaceae bacterium]